MENMKETIKAIKAIENLKKEPESEEKKIKKILLNNNLAVAIFADIMPKFCEIWNKNEGKQYGEKTRDKIQKEIENAFDNQIFCYTYSAGIWLSLRDQTKKFTNTNFDTIKIIPINYNVRLLKDNKIQKIEPAALMLYNGEKHTDNPEKVIKTLYKMHERARELQAELLQLCKNFDSITGGKINPIQYNYIVKNYII